EQTVTENTAVIPNVEETEPENSVNEIDPTEENPDIGVPDIGVPDIIQETPDSNGPVNEEILNGKPMISGFGNSEQNEDITVNDGEVLLSAPLEEAMEYYGDDVNYRVLFKFYHGGACIDPGAVYATLERKRLEDKGYVVALETVTEEEDNGLYVTTKIKYYFTLHATYEQLENFVPAGDLGYFVSLYEESFDEFENPDTSSYNDGMNSGS
ncbi:MAG: hypothetical protein IKX78_03065, partial [Clostridia bacterium]|nr:hypothetical protein [Clostridia bacterium]